jgi:hypothetical protein
MNFFIKFKHCHSLIVNHQQYFYATFMRRIISILFLSLMLLQFIPVLHFFSSHKEIFFACIDEEKLDDSSKEKKESKECLSIILSSQTKRTIRSHFFLCTDSYYLTPLLEFQTPPPDFG